MNAPTERGVLAMMDHLCMLATDKGAGGHEAREARAAVAKLIEAAGELRCAYRELPSRE